MLPRRVIWKSIHPSWRDLAEQQAIRDMHAEGGRIDTITALADGRTLWTITRPTPEQ